MSPGIWHGAQQHEDHHWQVQWATSVLLAGATFGVGLAVRRWRIPRWCAWLGVISYSVYLLHPLVFDAYRSIPVLHRKHTMPDQVLFFAGLLAVIIGLSALTYYLVEKPMQRLGRRVAAWAGYADRDRLRRRRLRRRAAGRGAGRGEPERVEQHRGRGRVRRLPVADRHHAPPGAAQPGGAHARVAGRAQGEAGQQRDPEAGRHQGLRRDEVVGGERDPRGEPGRRALLQQVLTAAVTPGDPPVLRQPRQVGGPQFGHRGRQRRLAAAHRRVRHDQVHRLGQQHLLAEVVLLRHRDRVVVLRPPCPAAARVSRDPARPPSAASCRKTSATST